MSRSEVSLTTTGEYLRLALPLMTKYRIPVTPQNYAVWYEYVAGGNASLTKDIDERIQRAVEITPDDVARLYRSYIDAADPNRYEEIQDNLKKLVLAVVDSIKKANGEAKAYEGSLRECADQISEDMTAVELQTVVERLSESTSVVTASSATLQQSLDESRREIDTLRQELETVKVQATTDALTGLANRKAFDERMEQIADQGGDMTTSVMIADIDKFKSINDTYGHLFGDRVLKAVAQALKQVIKGKDLAARFGGEEFVILLPETGLNGAIAVAENVRNAIQSGRIFNPKTGTELQRVTVSIGVTQLLPNEDVELGLARADEALYRAKESGRNRVEAATVEPPSNVVSL
ncbi:MAG: GGDEF domain-containing protein [Gammaproteobacteria bacterium]|nr:GGDEF domain-containing protein [Gammaproteobacteria bacterium]